MTDRLYRSPTDRVIAGVAGGMAVWLNIDPSLVRLVWVLLVIFSGGIFVLVYIAMMIIVPLPPPGWAPQHPNAGYAAGWGATGGSGAGAGSGDTPPGPPGTEGSAGAGSGQPGGWGSPPPAPGTATPGWTSPSPAATRGTGSSGGRGAGIVLGAVLIVIGAWFLVGRYIEIDWGVVWPIAVVVLGVGLMAASIRRSPPGGTS